MSTTVYIDIETPRGKGHDLKSNTLRQYTRWIRERGGILGLSVAVDDADPLWIPGTPPDEVLADLRAACEDEDTILVAFNASFDIRIMRLVLDLPHPRRVRCALDAAYAAWPNQPGALRADAGAGDDRSPKAYSLGSLAQTLGLGLSKLEMPPSADVTALGIYCNRDVELLRRLYKLECDRLSPNEWAINEMAQLVNSLHLEVRMDKVDQAVIAFDAALKAQVEGVSEILDPEVAATLFGTDGKRVRSVKQQKVRDALLNELGFDTPTISKKQINPMKLAVAPEASKVITHTSEVNKTLNQRRRIERFSGVPEVDVELHPFRAHTGRYSGPSTGKGLNLHNLPKRNPDLAKAVRSMFELPGGWCWVRADLANVEYRGTCLAVNSIHADKLFSGNILADPYSAFWLEGTGQVVTKKDPARHVAKGAVLGLSYMMGVNTWINVLLQELAAPKTGITTTDLRAIADAQGWSMTKYTKAHCTKMNADPAVGRVAQGSRETFHRVHPEIEPFSAWLVDSLTEACRSADPAGALDDMSRDPRAPDPDLIRLVWEDAADMERAVRVQIGGWDAPTVTWRDLGVRFIEGQGTGMALSFRQSGSKGYHTVYKSILTENVIQAWARVALCRGKLALRDLGYPTALSVHDEILLPVPCDRDSVLHARDSLLQVYGPGNKLGYGWAVVINPAEINVSKSLYEVELGKQWWADLEAGKTALLEELP